MTAALRPMSLGEICDRTFQIYRSRFFTFVALSTLPALAMMALNITNQFWLRLLPNSYGPHLFLWFTPQILLYQVALAHAEILFNLFMYPAFSLVVSSCVFGEITSSTTALASGFARWRSWIGLTLSNWCIPLIVPELLITSLVAVTGYLLFEVFKLDPSDPMRLGPKMLLASLAIGWLVFQWLSAATSFSLPIWMLERLKIGSALRRGWRVSKNSRMRVVLVRFVPIVIGWIMTLAIGSFASLFFSIFFGNEMHWWLRQHHVYIGILILTNCAVAAVVGPLFPIALTLIYYDQRIRLEGYDIEWMMNAVGMNAPVPAVTQKLAEVPASLEESRG